MDQYSQNTECYALSVEVQNGICIQIKVGTRLRKNVTRQPATTEGFWAFLFL